MKQFGELLRGNADVVRESKDVLGRLWRRYLRVSDLKAAAWQVRLNNHLQKVRDGGKCRNIADYKGNLKKALASETLPWDRLCLGMLIVNPDGFIFKLQLKLDDVTYSANLTIEERDDGYRGDLLKGIWLDIIDKFPERHAQWGDLVKAYANRGKGSKKRSNSSLNGNLKSGLSGDKITWRCLYTAIQVMDFDEFEVGVAAKGKELCTVGSRRKEKVVNAVNAKANALFGNKA